MKKNPTSENMKTLLAMRDMNFAQIETILRNYNYDEQDMLQSFVAWICNVDVADMLSQSMRTELVRARYLYWYALRTMTGETYQTLSERTVFDGFIFSKNGIRQGCELMGELIETENIWKNRWIRVRRLLKLMHDPHDYNLSDNAKPNPQKYKLLLTVPKGMKDNVEIELNEKED